MLRRPPIIPYHPELTFFIKSLQVPFIASFNITDMVSNQPPCTFLVQLLWTFLKISEKTGLAFLYWFGRPLVGGLVATASGELAWNL